jgi:hypothetical protein
LKLAFVVPNRQVRVLWPVIASSAGDVFAFHSEIAQRGKWQFARHDCGWGEAS